MELIAALAWFLDFAGYLGEAYERLEKALEISRHLPDVSAGMHTRLRASLLSNAGWEAMMLSINDKAEVYSEESITHYNELGNRAEIAIPYLTLGYLAIGNADYERAVRLGEQSLAISKGARDKWRLGLAVTYQGQTAQAMGDYAGAEAYYQESLDLVLEIGDIGGIAVTYLFLWGLSSQKGEYSQAMKYW
jgi:tetratricopeptide (TPR) repeat protein